MYKKHSITGSARPCPSLFTENRQESVPIIEECPRHITSKEGLPACAQWYQLRNEVKTGHPSKCLPVNTHAMEKMILNRQSKISSIMRTSPKHFLISLRTQPTAPPVQFSCHYSYLFQEPPSDQNCHF